LISDGIFLHTPLLWRVSIFIRCFQLLHRNVKPAILIWQTQQQLQQIMINIKKIILWMSFKFCLSVNESREVETKSPFSTKYHWIMIQKITQYLTLVKAGVLKLFCIATHSKYFQNFCDPKMSQTTTNLRLLGNPGRLWQPLRNIWRP
jgi:hypothetical protein